MWRCGWQLESGPSDPPPELVGCAVVADVGVLAPVAPSASAILTWEPFLRASPILTAERVRQHVYVCACMDAMFCACASARASLLCTLVCLLA